MCIYIYIYVFLMFFFRVKTPLKHISRPPWLRGFRFVRRQDLPPADSLDAAGRVVCPGPDAEGRKGRQGRGR